MTTSNHRPYTYPDGKIDIPSHTGRSGGVKYADYAINKFLDEINPAQITLIIGSHLGNLQPLVENYLPKAAIDRIQERMFRNLEKRRVIPTDKTESDE